MSWIPTNNELPDDETVVMVAGIDAFDEDDMHPAAYLMDGKWFCHYTDKPILITVTHWQNWPLHPSQCVIQKAA